MRARQSFSLFVLLLGLCPGFSRAEIVALYDAGAAGNPVSAPNPSTPEGGSWASVVPSSDTGNFASAAVSPDGTSGLNAWRVLDNSTAGAQFLYWSKPLSATSLADMMTQGWRLRARMRVADPVASNGGANSVYLYVANNANKRWILFLDINAAGNLVVTPAGGAAVTITGVDPAQYHEHEMTYNPGTLAVEYRVDGVVKIASYTGTTGAGNGARWGTESSGGRGDGYFNRVELEVFDPPGPPLATVHPSSQDVPVGSNAVFTAAFRRAPTGFQWFKDTLPLAGATNASLTVSAAAAVDAGDYWCRATNTLGVGETRTAALHLLTPGAEPVIAEFVAANDSGLRDEDADRTDWIEIRNPSTSPLLLDGWALSDDPLLPRKWIFPAVTLAAGERRLVFASGKDRRLPAGELHANFALGTQGGFLSLSRPNGSPAHVFAAYPEQFSDTAFGLTAHQPALHRRFAVPSPGAANTDGQTAVRAPPVLAPADTTFRGTMNVSVNVPASAPVGGALRGTQDGRAPTFDSPLLATNLVLSASTPLRAAWLFPGERFGATASASYVRVGDSLSSFRSPLPIVVLHNFGGGPVPGVSARGPNGDGSEVVAVEPQAQGMLILDEALGDTSPTGTVVSATRAGLRLRGSSSFFFARKSYALETWSSERDAEADRALLDLPADSDWGLYGPDPAQFDAPLIHNSFMFEAARRAGYPAPRVRFVELFLNTTGGDLTAADNRGLYLLMERPKRGADRVDFPALNAAGTRGGWMLGIDRMDALPPGSSIAALVPRHFHTAGPDGILQTPEDNPRGFIGPYGPGGLAPARDDLPGNYNSFFNFASPGGWYITAAQRAAIQASVRGFDAALFSASWQDPLTGYAPHIDRRNWAQFLALVAFSKNTDNILLSTYLYRASETAPLRFGPLWDFDRAFNKNTADPSATTTLNHAFNRSFFQRLTTDPDFMQAYTDVWQAMRRGGFSTTNLHAIVDAQVAEITDAVAQRSGLAAGVLAANAATLKTWLDARANAFDAQFPAPPVFSHPGGAVPAGFVLGMSAPAGTLYYTLDGGDPRAPGGSVAPGAVAYTGAVAVVSNTLFTARVHTGSAWSGPTTATYLPPRDYTSLRISEIHYHPAPVLAPVFVDGDAFEFLELKNTGSAILDLAGLSFTNGIAHTFPPGAALAPGAFWVLARDEVRFTERHGRAPDGLYDGKLHNAGEALALVAGDSPVAVLTYSDSAPWPVRADGLGFSLQRPDPSAPGHAPSTWVAATPTPWADLSLADTDLDGLPDYWEAPYGDLDPESDLDGDGMSALREFLAGTQPDDASSVFHLDRLPVSGEFSFAAQANRAYRLQRAEVLGGWTDLTVWPPAADDRILTAPIPTGSFPRVYFRVATP